MKNKRIVILTILLVLVLLLFFLWKKKEAQSIVPAFNLQGETQLSEGKFQMKIWDNNTEDGDTVAVYFANKKMADSLAILNNPVIIELGELKKGVYILGVDALSEGFASPSSCSVSLSNGKEEKEFEMNAWIDSAASWKVVVQ